MIVVMTAGEQVSANRGDWPTSAQFLRAPVGVPAWPHAQRMLAAMAKDARP